MQEDQKEIESKNTKSTSNTDYKIIILIDDINWAKLDDDSNEYDAEDENDSENDETLF